MQFSAKLKWPSVSKLVTVELSDGTSCEARYIGDSEFSIKWRKDIEFEYCVKIHKLILRLFPKPYFTLFTVLMMGKKRL